MNSKLAIYDVRGIQKYIFATNKVKEIVGASNIVKNLVKDEFNNAIDELKNNQEITDKEVIIDYQNIDSYSFDSNFDIKIEVLYYGGGNLVVLYRTEELLEKVSTIMAKGIMNNAYGLSLVYAYVDKTNDYNSDWAKLKEQLSCVKAVTPPNKPIGIIPIVDYDKITGKPFSKIYDNEKVTYESYQKLKSYEKIEQTHYIKEFDKMRTSETEGLIAIVHIDGNSMGMNIRNIMSDVKTYEEAVKRLRKISSDIHDVFEKKAIEKVEDKIYEIAKKHDIKIKKDELPFRPLIQAGDDITFVCNARLALDIAVEYIDAIKDECMYSSKYPFSACAGIAIIHSHYPFYKGYQIAEECCQSAKNRAKHEGMINSKVANFVDFEYCYTNSTSDLETKRKDYKNIDGYYLLKRPYGIYEENEELNSEQKLYTIDNLYENLKLFNGISRSVAKKFRDDYYQTESSIKTSLLKQEKKKNIKYDDPFILIGNQKYANYYDALELMDIFGAKGDNIE